MITKKEKLAQAEKIKELATKLFDGVWEDAVHWMQTPQECFFNKTALQLVAEGSGDKVIEFLEVRVGGRPGAAF